MIRDVMLPQLTMGMSQGTVVEWLVAAGGAVKAGEPLVSIETEKVVLELEAPFSGVLGMVTEVGATVPTETVIAQIADSAEELAHTQPSRAQATGGKPPAEAAHAAPEPEPASGQTALLRVRASGLARKIAAEHGVDLSLVTGAGPGGRIEKADVEAAISKRLNGHGAPRAEPPAEPQERELIAATVTPSKPPQHEDIRTVKARVPLTAMRRTIASRMSASKATAPHAHLIFEINAGELKRVHARLRNSDPPNATRIALTAFYIRVLALACTDVPAANASYEDGEIVLWDDVNVGLAVAVPGASEHESGLVVPVVRGAQRKGLKEIDTEVRDLVQRAREGSLKAGDLAGATVTLSSLDRYRSPYGLVGTPLLTLPQAVAFSPGCFVEKPVLDVEGRVVAGTVLPCCVTFDHRVLDGGPASELTNKIGRLLSHPELLML
ncbi:hypothetical protein C7T35_21590 [Variovorax sp. WS11]|uniref:dihydrolipoamide acetyltransferase family protein n=1 Tax=Variovorax sp. WS11 TaxID=1105204 RepID=UPI000D0E1E2C|nr:dihydrolipoamide acetyltransferase family protein [Variovorax sp. WS11]NDZ18921.1 2-oxo acid dehydrogenase subunit E2 [Variovorax sp. WS11]PSL82432.1 hypothetical protein C7T35_21590 [Variovorax sp. WS11]